MRKVNFTLAILAASLLLALPVQADLRKDLTRCTAMSSATERLACFDDAASANAVQASETRSASHGVWMVRKEVSKLDDSTTVTAYTPALVPIPSRFGGSVTPELYVRCMEGTFSIFVNFAQYIGIGKTMVTYRVNKSNPHVQEWLISSNHEAAFAPAPRFLSKYIADGSRLLVQITPFGENSVLAEFDLSGSAAAVAEALDVCGR